MATSGVGNDEDTFDYFKGQLGDYCHETATSWVDLQNIVTRHWDSIRKRIWRKDVGKLRTITKAATFTLPNSHRPDINGVTPPPKDYKGELPCRPLACFMWPYLNQEDLTHGDALLHFIYHRSQHHWREYLHTDLYSTRGGKELADIQPWWDWSNPNRIRSLQPPNDVEYAVTFKSPEINETWLPPQSRFERDECYFEIFRTQIIDTEHLFSGSFWFKDALMVAHIQSRIYSFLVDVCREILQPTKDVGEQWTKATEEEKAEFLRNATDNERYPKLSQEQMLPPDHTSLKEEKKCCKEKQTEGKQPGGGQQEEEGTGKGEGSKDQGKGTKDKSDPEFDVPTLSELRILRPYGPPGALNAESLESLRIIIEAEVERARVALVTLRQDPTAFVESVRAERNALLRPEMAKLNELDHAVLDTWAESMKRCVGNAIKEFERWSALQNAFDALKDTHDRTKPTLDAGPKSEGFEEDAKRVDEALYRFWWTARELAHKFLKELVKVITQTSTFDKYIAIEVSRGETILKLKPMPGEADRKRVLSKLISFVTDEREAFGLAALLDDLHWELEVKSAKKKNKEDDAQPAKNSKNKEDDSKAGASVGPEDPAPKKKKRNRKKKDISPREYIPTYVHDIVGHVGLWAECIDQVERFQPWATLLWLNWNPGVDTSSSGISTAPKEVVQRRFINLEQQLKRLEDEKPWAKVVHLGLPRGDTFEHPIEQRPNAETKRKIASAEKYLDDFWKPLIQNLNKQGALSPDTLTLLEQPREKAKVGDDLAKEGDQGREQVRKGKEPVTVRPQQPPQTETRDKPGPGPAEPPTTTSPKRTRDEAEEGRQKKRRKTPSPDRTDKILLSPENYASLKWLFCIPGNAVGRQGLPWRNFLNLMHDIGFEAMPKSGSKWTFVPSQRISTAFIPADRRGGIRIDAPHARDGSTIPFHNTRRYGSAFARLGLSFDCFDQKKVKK